jgi:hypothetical protein
MFRALFAHPQEAITNGTWYIACPTGKANIPIQEHQRKLHKTKAAIWFNKACKYKKLTPNYILCYNDNVHKYL